MVTEHEGRVFDRVENWDARNAEFPLQLIAEPDEAINTRPLRTKNWSVPIVLDQGKEGACTGFGTSHMLSATPKPRDGITNKTAYQLYKDAQRLDEWPGEAYEGSSVTGAMKAASAKGWVPRYVWPRTAREVALAVYVGPVVIGVDWHERMMKPDPSGYLHADGSVVGGHCVCIYGFSAPTESFSLVNSWGKDWGHDGTAKLTMADLDRLLGRGGDAALATKAAVK